MHGKTVVRAVLPVVLCLTVVLWLVWGFLTWPVAGKTFLTLVALLVAGMLARRRYRQQRPVQLADEAGIFPSDSHTGPVVLVCGDVDDNMFAAGQTRGTAQGWYLRISAARLISISCKISFLCYRAIHHCFHWMWTPARSPT
ncbi:hypothetical protein ABFP30_003830 [Enterobacter bugandensis]